MPRNVWGGNFYAFDRRSPDFEIGRQISRTEALSCLRSGGDVYTPARSDAKALAKDVFPGRAEWDGSHRPRPQDWDFSRPGNRRFPHYHPGGDHTFGHCSTANEAIAPANRGVDRRSRSVDPRRFVRRLRRPVAVGSAAIAGPGEECCESPGAR
jgi:hypothetical protein